MSGRAEEVDSQWSRDRRASWRLSSASLLMIGLIVGLVAALIYTWLVAPVEYIQVSPARLSDEEKAEYIYLISQSYAADENWDRAQARLSVLGDSQVADTLSSLLDESVRRGDPAPRLRNLANLAVRLGVRNPAVSLFAPGAADSSSNELATREPTVTPTSTRSRSILPTPTHTPTRAPTPTALPVYRLLVKEKLCQPDRSINHIEIEVIDALLDPLPGAEIVVRWDGGEDSFFSGYYPEKGLGYADFEMSAGVAYSVMMADGSPIVEGITIEACEGNAEGQNGGWRLRFQNTDVQQESS